MVTEVLQGFRSDADDRTAKSLLLELPVFEIVGLDVALLAIANHRRLRTRGVSVRKTIDTLIATYCIRRRLPLLYSDRDFDPFVEHLGLKDAARV